MQSLRKVEQPTTATNSLADILELLAILKHSEDPESKDYVFQELRKYFAQERARLPRRRRARR